MAVSSAMVEPPAPPADTAASYVFHRGDGQMLLLTEPSPNAYNILGGVDQVIPVDAFVPGCAAHPQSIMDGVLKAVEILEHKQQQRLERGAAPERNT